MTVKLFTQPLTHLQKAAHSPQEILGGGQLPKDQLYQCWIICHFIIELNQKNNTLQQDCGVHLSFRGASDDAITAGSLLGFNMHPRSVFNHQKSRAMRSTSNTDTIIKSAIEVQCQTLLSPITSTVYRHLTGLLKEQNCLSRNCSTSWDDFHTKSLHYTKTLMNSLQLGQFNKFHVF